MFTMGNATFALQRSRKGRLTRLAVRRKLEDAYWRRIHAHCLRCRRGHAPPVPKPNTNLNQRPPRALFWLKLDNSCCYAHYSCGNNCNVVVKLVQEYHCYFLIHFTSVLCKQFAANDMFLREANSYKRALALKKLAVGSSLGIRQDTWLKL